MKLKHGLHLAYCTNVHRGETWAETFAYLNDSTLAVKKAISPNAPYAIGLRLSDVASKELMQGDTLPQFKKWLEKNDCYVFTINGFPFGRFHGTRVKENVYRPDWSTPERLDYTNRLFSILAEILPEGMEGSVSTLPGSFKEFITDESQLKQIRDNIIRCAEFIQNLQRQTGKRFHLGLEPEPLGLFETTPETLEFFSRLPKSILDVIGVNYDSCHLAVEFENPREAIGRLNAAGIKISKIHLSSALKVLPTPECRLALAKFIEPVYLHQVVENGVKRYKDLDLALAAAETHPPQNEWRIHFHIPIHSPRYSFFDNTIDHVEGILDLLAANPGLCQHLEMETYTWEVLPPELKKASVVEQIEQEYRWALDQLFARGLN